MGREVGRCWSLYKILKVSCADLPGSLGRCLKVKINELLSDCRFVGKALRRPMWKKQIYLLNHRVS